jgi:hypothetical protein
LWTLAVLAVLLLPSACAFIVQLLTAAMCCRNGTSPPPQALRAATAQTALTLAFLPYGRSSI